MNKKAIYESIMTSVSKEVKKALLEYRTKATESYDVNIQEVKKYLKISIQQWVIDKFERVPQCYHGFYSDWRNGGTIYIHFGDVIEGQPINVYISNRSYVTNIKDDLQKIVEYMKDHKEFKLKAASIARKERLEYEYYPNKDEELYTKLEAAKNKFEADVEATDTAEFAPTKRDWEKMIGYMNNHSNPERVAKSCKDHHKIVARYIIAKTLGWTAAAQEFNYAIKREHILDEAQLEAYARKYATYNIPEEYADLIDNMKEFDSTGGLNQQENADILPNMLKKYIHEVSDIQSYTITVPAGKNLIPVRKTPRYYTARNIHNPYTMGNAKCVILNFTLIDGTQKDLILLLYHGNYAILNRDINGLNYVYNDVFEDSNSKTAIRDIKHYLNIEN